MPSSAVLLAVFGLAGLVAGQSSTSLAPAQITHVITVSNNLTATNGSSVFSPQVVTASLGETVLFNFTQGNHSATQSTFAQPCIPAHEANATLNGFDTSIRPAGNGTSVTNFPLIMNADIVNNTIWFYDQTTCGIGGVGVINIGNVSATLETIDGFTRNAIRLNGTGAHSSSSSAGGSSATGGSGSGTASGSQPSSSGGSGSQPSAALRLVPTAAVVALMALGAALVL